MTQPQERQCSSCGESLLVDVVAVTEGASSRSMHLAARKIDRLGGAAPSFAQLKDLFDRGSGVIANSCTRAQGLVFKEILERHDIACRLVPAHRFDRQQPAAAGSLERVRRGMRALESLPSWLRLGTGALVLLLGLVWLLRGNPGPRATLAHDPASPDLPSTREVAALATRASVQLRCASSVGAGFFISPEYLVTNAHVLCQGAQIEVVLADERVLGGQVSRSDPWLDLAVVKVSGAGVSPLVLGDATVLAQGDPLLVVGNPYGLEFTVSKGILSHAARVILGISYLQLDAGIHPGNSGGPVLDQQGRVVGVTAMSLANASSLGLAIPVNYLFDNVADLVELQRTEEERLRFTRLLQNAAAKESEELAQLRSELGHPSLLAASLVPPGMVEVRLGRVSGFPPAPEDLSFSLVAGDVQLCAPTCRVDGWQSLPAREASFSQSRFLTWLSRHDMTSQLYQGSALLNLKGCPAPAQIVGAELILAQGDARSDHQRITSVSGR